MTKLLLKKRGPGSSLPQSFASVFHAQHANLQLGSRVLIAGNWFRVVDSDDPLWAWAKGTDGGTSFARSVDDLEAGELVITGPKADASQEHALAGPVEFGSVICSVPEVTVSGVVRPALTWTDYTLHGHTQLPSTKTTPWGQHPDETADEGGVLPNINHAAGKLQKWYRFSFFYTQGGREITVTYKHLTSSLRLVREAAAGAPYVEANWWGLVKGVDKSEFICYTNTEKLNWSITTAYLRGIKQVRIQNGIYNISPIIHELFEQMELLGGVTNGEPAVELKLGNGLALYDYHEDRRTTIWWSVRHGLGQYAEGIWAGTSTSKVTLAGIHINGNLEGNQHIWDNEETYDALNVTRNGARWNCVCSVNQNARVIADNARFVLEDVKAGNTGGNSFLVGSDGADGMEFRGKVHAYRCANNHGTYSRFADNHGLSRWDTPCELLFTEFFYDGAMVTFGNLPGGKIPKITFRDVIQGPVAAMFGLTSVRGIDPGNPVEGAGNSFRHPSLDVGELLQEGDLPGIVGLGGIGTFGCESLVVDPDPGNRPTVGMGHFVANGFQRGPNKPTIGSQVKQSILVVYDDRGIGIDVRMLDEATFENILIERRESQTGAGANFLLTFGGYRNQGGLPSVDSELPDTYKTRRRVDLKDWVDEGGASRYFIEIYPWLTSWAGEDVVLNNVHLRWAKGGNGPEIFCNLVNIAWPEDFTFPGGRATPDWETIAEKIRIFWLSGSCQGFGNDANQWSNHGALKLFRFGEDVQDLSILQPADAPAPGQPRTSSDTGVFTRVVSDGTTETFVDVPVALWWSPADTQLYQSLIEVIVTVAGVPIVPDSITFPFTGTDRRNVVMRLTKDAGWPFGVMQVTKNLWLTDPDAAGEPE